MFVPGRPLPLTRKQFSGVVTEARYALNLKKVLIGLLVSNKLCLGSSSEEGIEAPPALETADQVCS